MNHPPKRWLWPASESKFLRHENYWTMSYATPTAADDETYLSGSEDEMDGIARRAKRRRIMTLGQSYLNGKPLYISSAVLKGPFESSKPLDGRRASNRAAVKSPAEYTSSDKVEGHAKKRSFTLKSRFKLLRLKEDDYFPSPSPTEQIQAVRNERKSRPIGAAPGQRVARSHDDGGNPAIDEDTHTASEPGIQSEGNEDSGANNEFATAQEAPTDPDEQTLEKRATRAPTRHTPPPEDAVSHESGIQYAKALAANAAISLQTRNAVMCAKLLSQEAISKALSDRPVVGSPAMPDQYHRVPTQGTKFTPINRPGQSITLEDDNWQQPKHTSITAQLEEHVRDGPRQTTRFDLKDSSTTIDLSRYQATDSNAASPFVFRRQHERPSNTRQVGEQQASGQVKAPVAPAEAETAVHNAAGENPEANEAQAETHPDAQNPPDKDLDLIKTFTNSLISTSKSDSAERKAIMRKLRRAMRDSGAALTRIDDDAASRSDVMSPCRHSMPGDAAVAVPRSTPTSPVPVPAPALDQDYEPETIAYDTAATAASPPVLQTQAALQQAHEELCELDFSCAEPGTPVLSPPGSPVEGITPFADFNRALSAEGKENIPESEPMPSTQAMFDDFSPFKPSPVKASHSEKQGGVVDMDIFVHPPQLRSRTESGGEAGRTAEVTAVQSVCEVPASVIARTGFDDDAAAEGNGDQIDHASHVSGHPVTEKLSQGPVHPEPAQSPFERPHSTDIQTQGQTRLLPAGRLDISKESSLRNPSLKPTSKSLTSSTRKSSPASYRPAQKSVESAQAFSTSSQGSRSDPKAQRPSSQPQSIRLSDIVGSFASSGLKVPKATDLLTEKNLRPSLGSSQSPTTSRRGRVKDWDEASADSNDHKEPLASAPVPTRIPSSARASIDSHFTKRVKYGHTPRMSSSGEKSTEVTSQPKSALKPTLTGSFGATQSTVRSAMRTQTGRSSFQDAQMDGAGDRQEADLESEIDVDATIEDVTENVLETWNVDDALRRGF